MAQARGNAGLAAVIAQTGWSHAQAARAFVRVAIESGATELAGVGKSHVTHWIGGSRPSGRAPRILCETLSRRLGRVVTLDEIGLGADAACWPAGPDWDVDTLVALADLGRYDTDMDRRTVLGSAVYSTAALALPDDPWWARTAERGAARATPAARTVGRGDLDAVRDMVGLFSRVDQRRGGGHARTAVVQYLTSDVAGYLRGHFPDGRVRREMFSAASELAYLSGWMAFDNAEHAVAQSHFTLASPRERALLGVVHARALAAAGDRQAAAAALIRAEDDLAAASPGDDEPARVFFFGEASLAHETACTLRDLGDLPAATRQFRRSVATRKAATFTRTHAVTLGYLGAVQARHGSLDEACATWSRSLDAMDGVRSGRTRQVVADMRAVLSQFRHRGIRAVTDLDARAAAYLSTSG